jgi:hypothetical protein
MSNEMDALNYVKQVLHEFADGLKLPEHNAPKSGHKAGEVFKGKVNFSGSTPALDSGLEYAGKYRHTYGIEWHVGSNGFAFYSQNSALCEILRPRKPKQVYKVGQEYKIKDTNNPNIPQECVPSGKYVYLGKRYAKAGDIILSSLEDHVFRTTLDQTDAEVFAPSLSLIDPATGLCWYDVKLAPNVLARVYEDEDDGREETIIMFSHSPHSYTKWNRTGKEHTPLDYILNAVDASLLASRGEGIRIVPLAVSGGNFTAPEGK